MEQKELQELFCTKIMIEYEFYRRKVQKCHKGWILNHVYEIELKARIYETLRETAGYMEADMLRILLVLPEVIHLFYRKWMKYRDNSQGEITACISMTMKKISMKYIEIDTGVTDKGIGKPAA